MVMIFVFLLGWIYFSRYLNSQLHHTKNYLQVIDINTLIDNSYILTYIKKNSSLWKNKNVIYKLYVYI